MKTLHFLFAISFWMLAILVMSHITDIQACTPYENCTRTTNSTVIQTASFSGNHGTYAIPYNMTNGRLVASLLDVPAKELIFTFNATGDGKLTVELPRKIIDSIRDGKDKPYLVFVGNSETDPKRIKANEIQIDNETRTLVIDFTKGDNEIGIVGTWFIENNSTSTGWNPFGAFTPLQQYKKGIAANDVKCKESLQLVIKSEDGSPACVKPEHLTRLSQYGWTIPNLKIIGDHDIANNGLSESNCGQFHTIPENKSDSNEIPVLILQQNSIGCAKITFTVNFLFNNTNDCMGCNSQMVSTAEFLSIGKYNFSRHGDLISGSSGKDYTNSFQIASVPKIVDVSKYPIGSNFTAVFIIKPLPNATGFYDYSIVKPMCNAYPLAVGYSPDQVNSSDFSEGLSFMQNHPCVMGSYEYSHVQVAGINYVQMKLD